MAYSYVHYTGNGSTKNFTVTFPYLNTTHVTARIGGVLTNAYTYLNSSTLSFTEAPTGLIEIRRTTPKDTAIVNFQDGSVLLEKDLDLSVTFTLYIAQEAEDILKETIYTASDYTLTASGKRISSLADPVNPQDAVTKVWAETGVSSQLALAIAQETNAAASASASSVSAIASANSASISTTQAGISTAQATIATTQAGIATTKELSTTASASAANTSALNAATSAATSTAQAVIATTQATTSTSQATIATGKAVQTASDVETTNTAKLAAQAAATAATLATTNPNIMAIGLDLSSAGIENIADYGSIEDAVTTPPTGTSKISALVTALPALNSVYSNIANVNTVASNNEAINTVVANVTAINNAPTQASNAATSASNATTQASNASASASSASSSATVATTQASLATTNGATQVGLATAQVALATTQVGLATTQASNASSSATAAALSAVNALAAAGGGVSTFNTRGGTVTLLTADVTTALGYTPYNTTNPSSYTGNLGTVTAVTASSPIVSTGGTTPALSLAAASITASHLATSLDLGTI